MTTITWDNRYALGIRKIDEQHAHLFDLIDKAFELFKITGQDRFAEAVKLIEELEQYVIKHFSEEEEGLRAIKYPAFDAHKVQHKIYIDRIALEKKNIITTKNLNPVLLGFLVNWLQVHIDKEDRAYATYAESIGAKNIF